MVPEEFVVQWIEGQSKYTQVGYWVHILDLVTGESQWTWEGERDAQLFQAACEK